MGRKLKRAQISEVRGTEAQIKEAWARHLEIATELSDCRPKSRLTRSPHTFAPRVFISPGLWRIPHRKEKRAIDEQKARGLWSLDCYQERNSLMEIQLTARNHFPSAPQKPAKYSTTFRLRPDSPNIKYSTMGFLTPEAMRSYIELVIGDEDFTWLSENCISVPATDLHIHCQQLEEVMDTTETINLPHPYPSYASVAAGRPEQTYEPPKETKKARREKQPKTSKPKRTRKSTDGMITIGQIADELGISASKARKVLRDNEVEKPATGWEWTEKAAKSIKKLISST